MLDIVMVAHKPNYTRMAHRGLSPNGSLTKSSILGSLPSVVDLVPVAGKVILSLEGGRHQDFEAAEAYLSGQNLTWQIVHNDEVTSYHEALMRGLDQCSSQLVAIVPCWIEVTDPLWVQRMLWPLQTDQTCLLCTTWAEQGPAKDLAPHVATPRKWPGGEILVGRRDTVIEQLRLSGPNYEDLAKGAAQSGWRIWAHPGIRFTVHEHAHHETRKETPRQAK
jgi:hypothetical protein